MIISPNLNLIDSIIKMDRFMNPSDALRSATIPTLMISCVQKIEDYYGESLVVTAISLVDNKICMNFRPNVTSSWKGTIPSPIEQVVSNFNFKIRLSSTSSTWIIYE